MEVSRSSAVHYKVFLVEDEIVTREGIRDNVNWNSAGFDFTGEAPDGEIALPLIQAAQPDVIITDIKMPFMDGLQLSKIIREHMPWVKIIIMSGYDDFSYAQSAIQLGITEYLLKPVGVQDLQASLIKVAAVLDHEKTEREDLKRLRGQVEENIALLRNRFLLRLLLGGESTSTVVEQSQQLGLSILAKWYLAMVIKIDCGSESPLPLFDECQQIETAVADLISQNMDAILTKKDIDELILILKGESDEQIQQEGDFLAGLIQQEVGSKTPCRLVIGLGKPQQRLGDLHRSFSEALLRVTDGWSELEYGDLKKLDQGVLQRFLESGLIDDFDAFFETYIQPLGESALRHRLIKQFFLLDILLSAAQFVSNLGANGDQVIPERLDLEDFLARLNSIDQIRTETKRIFAQALAFRDSQTKNGWTTVIQQAKTYLDSHYTDANLSLNEVAAQVNFSPNHFSAVFSRETGETFKDYLTRLRTDQAKKLLRTTNLKCSEVAFNCGYNDPHYFSMIFRKNTGFTPQQFRDAPKKKIEQEK